MILRFQYGVDLDQMKSFKDLDFFNLNVFECLKSLTNLTEVWSLQNKNSFLHRLLKKRLTGTQFKTVSWEGNCKLTVIYRYLGKIL